MKGVSGKEVDALALREWPSPARALFKAKPLAIGLEHDPLDDADLGVTRFAERRFSRKGEGKGSRALGTTLLPEPRNGEDDEAYSGSDVCALK